MFRCEYVCVFCRKRTILNHDIESGKDLCVEKDMVCLECQAKHVEVGVSLWNGARAALESPNWREVC